MIAVLSKIWDWRNLIIPAAALVACAVMWFLADYRLTERDKAVSAREVAEAQLQHARESAAAIIAALEMDREETDERTSFVQDLQAGIAADRLGERDGPLAPVLADTVERLRARQSGAASR